MNQEPRKTLSAKISEYDLSSLSLVVVGNRLLRPYTLKQTALKIVVKKILNASSKIQNRRDHHNFRQKRNTMANVLSRISEQKQLGMSVRAAGSL